MKPRVYLETTNPSYLTAWPSRDLVRAAHQQITRDWWDRRRTEFELYISQVVLRECQAGDATAAAERLKILQELPLLEQTEEATRLAQALVDRVPLPERAAVDALHVAILMNCLPRRETDMDDILIEVRKAREAYAKEFGFDLQAIHRD